MAGQNRYSNRSGSLAEVSDYGFSGKSSILHDFPSKTPEMELSRPKTTESQHSDTLRTMESLKEPPSDDEGDEKRISFRSEGPPAKDTNLQMQEADSKIHVRKLVQWRAKLPRGETTVRSKQEVDRPKYEIDDPEKGMRRQGTGGTLRRLTIRRSTGTGPAEPPKPMEIALHWHIDETKEKKDEGKTTFGIYINQKSTPQTRKDRLMWQ
jgi:hypothetical protein